MIIEYWRWLRKPLSCVVALAGGRPSSDYKFWSKLVIWRYLKHVLIMFNLAGYQSQRLCGRRLASVVVFQWPHENIARCSRCATRVGNTGLKKMQCKTRIYLLFVPGIRYHSKACWSLWQAFTKLLFYWVLKRMLLCAGFYFKDLSHRNSVFVPAASTANR